jgi:O-Antigen ligase
MSAPTIVYQPHTGRRLLRPNARPLASPEARERSIRRQILIIWVLLLVNVIPFYKGTWNGLPLIISIPSIVGKGITQGSLPVALALALWVNPKRLIRPNVFLCLLLSLCIAAVIANVDPTAGRFISTLYRTVRLTMFVATFWLLTPWWGRRDLLLVRCHVKALWIIVGTVLAGFAVSPSRALAQGRLSGEFWPITPVQVADYTAVLLGLLVVMWFCGELSRRATLWGVAISATILLLTHTRTEVIALVAGILVAGVRMFGTESRVRKLFAYVGAVLSLGVTVFSGVLTTWLARGQDTSELTKLTGRTIIWTEVLNAPRDRFQVIFGYGLSNKGFNGLPIDSNWMAAYYDLGLVGVSICAACLLFVFVSGFMKPRSPRTAIALFMVTYLAVTSFTETGLSDASAYMLELAMAASLLLPPLGERGS